MKVLVPLDGSQVAECVLPTVEAWAKKLDMEITLLAVIQYPGPRWPGGREIVTREEAEVAAYLKQMQGRLTEKGLKVDIATKEGNPGDAIIDFASEGGFELIAMSTHGLSGVERWLLGSVTEKVVRHSPVPVLVVRGPAAIAQMNKKSG